MGFLQRGLLIYLCIAIAVCMAMPSAVFNGGSPAENTVLSWFDLNYNSVTGEITSGTTPSASLGNATNAFTTPTSPSGSGSILGFLDPVWQVFSWIPLIFKVIFSPILILNGPAFTGDSTMSMALLFIVGIPLTFLMIVGLIIWIRSGFA